MAHNYVMRRAQLRQNHAQIWCERHAAKATLTYMCTVMLTMVFQCCCEGDKASAFWFRRVGSSTGLRVRQAWRTSVKSSEWYNISRSSTESKKKRKKEERKKGKKEKRKKLLLTIPKLKLTRYLPTFYCKQAQFQFQQPKIQRQLSITRV